MQLKPQAWSLLCPTGVGTFHFLRVTVADHCTKSSIQTMTVQAQVQVQWKRKVNSLVRDGADTMLMCFSIWSVREQRCTAGWRTFDDTHSVDSCAPDVLCRVTAESHLLSLWMVDIGMGLIQHRWPVDSLTSQLGDWSIKVMEKHTAKRW